MVSSFSGVEKAYAATRLIRTTLPTMDNRTRSRDVSTEDVDRASSSSDKAQASAAKRSTAFYKVTDVDDPPFSRLFLLIPKTMSEDELRQAFQVHGTIQDIHMVRDRRNQESKGEPSRLNIEPTLNDVSVSIGIAYVKYEKASAAARAMEEMNGTVIAPHIRPVKVSTIRLPVIMWIERTLSRLSSPVRVAKGACVILMSTRKCSVSSWSFRNT